MKYLKLQNKGLLDMRLLSLMGGTTKSKDEFKIGQWGSGLKYTIAWLLKNNVFFKIFIGEKEVSITTHSEFIRDEEFEIIVVDGEKTSITTQMGGGAWEPWMIVRELWCNCLDEGEEVREITEITVGSPETTTFYIQLTPDLKEVWDNWTNYFIHDLKPMCVGAKERIYRGGDCLRIYKQGVLIYENKKERSLFAYDIRNATINELREFNGSASCVITMALSKANEDVIRYFLENVTDGHYEGTMDYGWYANFSTDWERVIGNGKLIHDEALRTINERGADIDLSGIVVVPKTVYKFLTTEFKGIGALRIADKVNEFFEIYDESLKLKIDQALEILEECRYFMHPELKYVFGVFGDKRIWARVKSDSKEILISESIKNKSIFDVAATLIEENEHFNTGFNDHTREFQQHFINLFTRTLFDKHAIAV